MKRIFLLTLISFLIGLNCSAQEYLSSFSSEKKSVDENKVLRNRNTVVSLPFYDDFRESKVTPDASKWQNKDVLINSGFSSYPVNHNTATFDILDETGKVYSYASSSPFIADSLISNPISLNGLSPSDSVYFSFYYQPQGNGDAPESTDSLVLMMAHRSDSSIVWNHVWSSEGMTLDSFLIKNDNQYFKHVLIPITKEEYFKDELIVLFYNYASIPSSMYPNDRSNVDNWNIDFIYMDKNRSYNDNSFPFVTFSEKSPSLLKRYQTMPYRQYIANPTAAIATDIDIFVSNMDSVKAKAQYICQIENMTSEWTFEHKSDMFDIEPYTTNGVLKENVSFKNFLFDMDEKKDTVSYLITHIINVEESSSEIKGDTLHGIQSFRNYYAYDDGTPEKGYGVVPGESCFATQYNISVSDTLCGVYLLFNRTLNDANYDFFDIVVWNDNHGEPGNEFYRLKNQRPIWDDEEIYKFAYYPFDKILKVNGTIYIGIMQHSKESINIGFDTSNDNSQYNFYDVGYGWKNSDMKGSLMMRPALGNNYVIKEEMKTSENRLSLYPNPSKNEINISELDAESCSEVMIFDMTGRMMKHFTNNVKLDVTDLPNGIYMMRVITKDGDRYTEKFMISK